jgi:hypothetical protein
MPEYVIVYQISKESSNWLFAIPGLIVLIVGCVLFVGKVRFGWRRPCWYYPVAACIFGIMWVFVVGGSVIQEDSRAWAAFETGDYSTVEGVVTDFHPMPYEGHDQECFSVQSQRFCYSDYVVTPGFHNTASHGGPIRAGIPVRVAYSGSVILRLDIAKADAMTPAQSKAAAELAARDAQNRSENDPIQQRMATAFLFTAVGLTLLWNLRWKRTMGFWLRPPYRPFTEYIFRAFFGLSLIGAFTQLIEQLRRHPLMRENLGPTIATTAIMCAVVGAMYAFALWMNGRRRPND